MQYADTRLEINLKAIKDNYNILRKKFTGEECSAVVKANAYGLGVERVAPALYDIGCSKFFVATLDEGLELRHILPDADIFIFHGVQKGQGNIFCEYNLFPVINSFEQMYEWQKRHIKGAVLHIDTGMNRLGISYDDIDKIKADSLKKLGIKYIMTHPACADEHNSPKNSEQLEKFLQIKKYFGKSFKYSFCNSYGIFLDKKYHFDLARPGMALYGLNPDINKNPMHNVINLYSKILQIRDIKKDDTVGYGATYKLSKGMRVATIAIGYADGYLRSLGNNGICRLNSQIVRSIGRVSMDLVTIDISAVKGDVFIGDEVEIMGNNISTDEIAEKAGTIGYELLTSLGGRYNKVYVG